MLQQKISSLDDGNYIVEGSDKTLDRNQVTDLLKSISTVPDIDEFFRNVHHYGEYPFEVKANTGVIVDLYEVEYPEPSDPIKETEELASHLDEIKDFQTQYLYPDSTTQDIIVGLRSEMMPDGSKVINPASGEKETTRAPARTSGWREALNVKLS